ncbi:MAG: HK97 gp10 family phage protein [Eubacteriales bacterium]|nr:HK97 gp10 family phage protein [Eubacteriales bacterium]
MEIIRNGDIIDIMDKASKKSVIALAVQICSQAKALAPWKHGRLRNSIMYKNNKVKGAFNNKPGELAEKEIQIGSLNSDKEMVVGFNLDYGIYQEFGTRKMKPQPFLRPAIALYQGQKAVNVIKKIHDEELRGSLKQGQKRETFF